MSAPQPKADLVHLTRVMALEVAGHGVRVNAVAQGYMKTELYRGFLVSLVGERLRSRIPQRRFGLPEELDGPQLLLASEAAGYITGSTVFPGCGHLVSIL